MTTEWPSNIGEYCLHKSTDHYAFYYYPMGATGFHQALEVEERRAITNESLTIVCVSRLSGSGWGAGCKHLDPLSFNWFLISCDLYKSMDKFLSGQPMTDRQIKSWMKRSNSIGGQHAS